MRSEFVSVLEKFLEGSLGLGGLQEWLLSRLQLILDSGDVSAIESANALDAAIVTLGEGLIDDQSFVNQVEASIRHMRTLRFNVAL